MMRMFILSVIASLVLGANAMAADPTTVASSTMVFQGCLADGGNGTYCGTLWMIDENGTAYGDGVSGFDIYAKNGAWATYDKAGAGTQDYEEGIVADHDAYNTGGGWGSYWDPDCADWYNYQLRLDAGKWYVEYNAAVGTDYVITGATCPTMSGTMDWNAMYAAEEDTGAYYSGAGTPESPGYAATFAAGKGQSTAGAWDMDWSWGSDYVPLELPGYAVTVDYVAGGASTVILTPAVPEPSTIILLVVGLFGLVSVRRR